MDVENKRPQAPSELLTVARKLGPLQVIQEAAVDQGFDVAPQYIRLNADFMSKSVFYDSNVSCFFLHNTKK